MQQLREEIYRENRLTAGAANRNAAPVMAEVEALDEVYEIHPEFIEALAEGPIEKLAALEDRGYQGRAREALRQGFLDGDQAGVLELGTGGGKTAVAFNLINKIPGKVLWLAPSNAALGRAVDEAESLKLAKSLKVVNGSDLDLEADIVFATSSMLMANDKFRKFAEKHFSLIVFDEGHHAMGKATRKMFDHFKAFQLYLTATPETTVSNLSKFAKTFFKYTSEDLIRHDGFPFWVLRRYEVKGEKIAEAKVIGDNYAIEDGQEEQILNMPHRYAICLKILREAIAKGEKTMCYLPSVNSSRKFVDDFVQKDNLLRGKVVHVDGKMDKRVVKKIADEFKAGRILAVCCNDLWTESIDVPDIKHVALADPCCSPRVLTQRIGRGSRPAKNKTHLTIHDVVSSVANLEDQRGVKMPLTVAGTMGLRKTADNVVLNGVNKGKVLFEEVGGTERAVRFVENTEVETEDILFSERLIDLSFMSKADLAVRVYKRFAEILETSLFNLVYSSENFLKRNEELELKYADGGMAKIVFKDAVDAAKLYGATKALEKAVQDDLQSLRESFNEKVADAIDGGKIKDVDSKTVRGLGKGLKSLDGRNYFYNENDPSNQLSKGYRWSCDVIHSDAGLGDFTSCKDERDFLWMIKTAIRKNNGTEVKLSLDTPESVDAQKIWKILNLRGIYAYYFSAKRQMEIAFNLSDYSRLIKNSQKPVKLKMIRKEEGLCFDEQMLKMVREVIGQQNVVDTDYKPADRLLKKDGGYWALDLYDTPEMMKIFREIMEVRAMGKKNILWTVGYFNEHFEELMFILGLLTENSTFEEQPTRLLALDKRIGVGAVPMVELKIDFIDLEIEGERPAAKAVEEKPQERPRLSSFLLDEIKENDNSDGMVVFNPALFRFNGVSNTPAWQRNEITPVWLGDIVTDASNRPLGVDLGVEEIKNFDRAKTHNESKPKFVIKMPKDQLQSAALELAFGLNNWVYEIDKYDNANLQKTRTLQKYKEIKKDNKKLNLKWQSFANDGKDADFNFSEKVKDDVRRVEKEFDTDVAVADSALANRLLEIPAVYFAYCIDKNPNIKKYFKEMMKLIIKGESSMIFDLAEVRSNAKNFRDFAHFLGMLNMDMYWENSYNQLCKVKVEQFILAGRTMIRVGLGGICMSN